MNELSIEEIKVVLGWSYPTALAWAKDNGRMSGNKWLVPANVVYAELQRRYQEIAESRDLILVLCPTYQPPAFA